MFDIDKQAIIEGIKEVGRIAFFAAITAILAWFSDKVGMLDPTSAFYVIGTLILRFGDKVLHEIKTGKFADVKGIAPF